MPMPTNNDYKRVNKNQDDAIAELVDAVVGREVPRAPYGDLVYKAALKLVDACKALDAVYNYRLTDFEEYKAEVERRRQIGLTIDPDTAETTSWKADINDPYGILDREKFHEGYVDRAMFARNPGGEWVDFSNLPAATINAICERDKRLPVFTDDLTLEDELKDYQPAVTR